MILHFLSVGDGSSYELHNLPFAYKINVTDQDYTMWEPYEFEFCGQVKSSFLGALLPACKGAVNQIWSDFGAILDRRQKFLALVLPPYKDF